MKAIEGIKEYAKTINFTVVENSFNTKTSKIKVICPNKHTKEVNYTNWKSVINKCIDCPKIVAKRERITIEYLQQLFSDKGFELLDTEYISSDVKLQYKCKCGNVTSSTIGNFKKMAYGCAVCAYKIIGTKLLLPFDEVVKLFTDMNYKILITENEYKNYKSIIKFECNKGHINETTVAALKNDHGCSICSGNKKLTYDFVKGQFEEADFIMISTIYVNARTLMEVKCKNNHNINISYDDFSQSNSIGKGCAYCAGCVKHTYEKVKQAFEDENYVLVSDCYVNAHTHLNYICPKGHKHHIAYTHFVSGKRCGICCESKGEAAIRKYLEDNDQIMTYTPEKRFSECKDDRQLPFDFYVNNQFLIEFDGIQHFEYEEDDFFGGEKSFIKCQKHDKIKTNYCRTKNLPFLRIPYTKLKEIPEIIETFVKDLKKNKSLIRFIDPSLYDYLK